MHTFLLIASLTAAAPERNTAMHQALDALVRLQPILASPRAFTEAATGARITGDLDALARVEHGFL